MTSSNANCFRPMHAVSNGFFQGDIPLNFALPLLVIQIVVVLLVTRSLAYLFRHIKQPRVLAEIIGGVLLGPTALGRNKAYMEKVFPTQSIPLLETVATMGLMFFIFMVGLELDLQALGRTGKRALMIGLAGIGVPFAISATLAGLVRNTIAKGSSLAPLIVFMGTPLSISAFSVLVRIMAELGLLSTDVGKVAVPAAAVNDVAVWTLLAVGVAIGGPKHNPLTPVWVLLCGAAFGVVMMTLVRMFMNVIARKALKQGKGTDLYVCITLVTVLVTGLCSDAIGVHPLLGPFLLGLVIPKGNDFPKMIIEKIEDFVTGLMLPLFFASSGLKTNLGSLHGVVSLAFLALFFATAAVGKIVGTFVTARLCGLPTRRALILGFLMNTKGLAVLIVLNVGRDLKALTDEAFAILVLTCLLTSFITFPVVSALSGGKGNNSMAVGEAEGMDMGSSSSGGVSSCVEAVEKGKKQQLRVMAAAYVTGGSGPAGDHEQMEQYAALVNLIEASRGNKKASGGAPLKLYALRVGELSERWSAIMRLQSRSGLSQKLVAGGAAAFIPSFQPSSTLSKVLVKPLAAISDLDHMHHHISTMAVKKRTNLIILPCLKPTPLLDEAALVANPSQHAVQVQSLVPKPYLHLLNNPSDAPCSLALLIIGSHSPSAIHPSFFSYKVVLLFRGGPDDREALYLACRMADHPGVLLRVIRYTCTTPNEEDVAMVSKQKLLDDQAISKLKEKSLEASSVVYEEEHLQDSCGLKDAVDQMAKALINDVNLVIVGRGVSRLSSSSSSDDTLDTYSSSSSSSSLGMFGDSLVGTHTNDETDFHACILVVQQCVSLNIEPMSMHLAKADANS